MRRLYACRTVYGGALIAYVYARDESDARVLLAGWLRSHPHVFAALAVPRVAPIRSQELPC